MVQILKFPKRAPVKPVKSQPPLMREGEEIFITPREVTSYSWYDLSTQMFVEKSKDE